MSFILSATAYLQTCLWIVVLFLHGRVYLLTYSTVHSPSWAANWFITSQKNSPNFTEPEGSLPHSQATPPVSILGQPNSVHMPTSHLLEIHPNIIPPSTPRSPHWSLSLRFPHQDPIHPPLLTHTRHMPSPSHSSRFYHPHNIGWSVLHTILKLFFILVYFHTIICVMF